MKTIKTPVLYALLLIVAITFSNCKKKNEFNPPPPAPAPTIKYYVVKYTITYYISNETTSIHDYLEIIHNGLKYTITDSPNTNMPTYELSLNGKTGDKVSLTAINFSSPGMIATQIEISIDGSPWKSVWADNTVDSSNMVTASASGTLP